MTRPYAHQPEADWAVRRYQRCVKGLGIVQQTVARPQGADVGVYDAGMDDALEAAAWGWFLEEPVDALRAHLAVGGALVRQVLAGPEGHDPQLHSVERWVAAALLAGDPVTAAEAGRRAVRPPEQEVDVFSVVVALLARGDDGVAGAEVQRLTAVVADPATAPSAASGLAHLDELAGAVLARDQARLDAAARARDAAVVARHRRAPARRRWTGVLDRSGAVLVLLGAQRGLALPGGVPLMPDELLRVV